jgi:hypothetical protein
MADVMSPGGAQEQPRAGRGRRVRKGRRTKATIKARLIGPKTV